MMRLFLLLTRICPFVFMAGLLSLTARDLDAGSDEPQEIEFRFDPPDGLRIEGEARFKSKSWWGGKSKRRWQSLVERADGRIIIKSRPKYDEHFFPYTVDPDMWDNHPDKKYAVTEFDSCGNLLSVAGYGDLLAQMRELTRQPSWDVLLDLAWERAQIRDVRQDLERIIPKLGCRSFATGEFVCFADSVTYYDADTVVCHLALFTVVRIGKPVKCHFGECVRLRFMQSSDPNTLRDFGGVEFDRFYQGEVRGAFYYADCPVEINIEGDWVLSPSTMMRISTKEKIRERWPIGPPREDGTRDYRESEKTVEQRYTFHR